MGGLTCILRRMVLPQGDKTECAGVDPSSIHTLSITHVLSISVIACVIMIVARVCLS